MPSHAHFPTWIYEKEAQSCWNSLVTTHDNIEFHASHHQFLMLQCSFSRFHNNSHPLNSCSRGGMGWRLGGICSETARFTHTHIHKHMDTCTYSVPLNFHSTLMPHELFLSSILIATTQGSRTRLKDLNIVREGWPWPRPLRLSMTTTMTMRWLFFKVLFEYKVILLVWLRC